MMSWLIGTLIAWHFLTDAEMQMIQQLIISNRSNEGHRERPTTLVPADMSSPNGPLRVRLP